MISYWGTGYTVYKHTNRVNGKVYIGQTKCRDLSKRWSGGHGYKDCRYMFSAIIKYGWINFDHEILETGLSKEEAFDREAYYIKFYKSNDPKHGYNIREDATPNTFSSEGMKSLRDSFSGARNHGAVAVAVFDLDGNRLETFETMREACDYTGVSPSYMSQKCQSGSGTVGMYICRYASDVDGISKLPQNMIYKKREMRHCWKSVACYDLDGNYLGSYRSVTEAAVNIGSRTSDISSCLKGKTKSAGGFMWRYDDGNPLQSIAPRSDLRNPKSIPVCQYDRFTGERIHTYGSITEAASALGCTINLIQKCLKGKLNTAANYIWKYESENIASVDPIKCRGGRYDRDVGEAAD